jgi:mannose-6-phosphate isomerase class I
VWLVSDVEGRSSPIRGGPHDGRLLRDLVLERSRDLLGDRLAAGAAPRFPLLLKLLEVQGALSVQVHPDAIAARRAGDGERGKHEAWFVLDAARGAEAILGLKTTASRDELRALAESGALGDRLSVFPLAQGLAIDIAPGTIHSVRGGALLLEVQETADITYRIFDWGAVGLDGKPRELQLDRALACARLAADPALRPRPPVPREAAKGVSARLVSSPAAPFRFEILELDPGVRAAPRGGGPEAWVSRARRRGRRRRVRRRRRGAGARGTRARRARRRQLLIAFTPPCGHRARAAPAAAAS